MAEEVKAGVPLERIVVGGFSQVSAIAAGPSALMQRACRNAAHPTNFVSCQVKLVPGACRAATLR